MITNWIISWHNKTLWNKHQWNLNQIQKSPENSRNLVNIFLRVVQNNYLNKCWFIIHKEYIYMHFQELQLLLKIFILKLTMTFPWQNELNNYGPMTSYGDIDLVSICSGAGLLPNGTTPLHVQMLTYHQGDLWHSHENIFPGNTPNINR